MIHGFFNIVGVGREAPAYNREIAERLRHALAEPAPTGPRGRSAAVARCRGTAPRCAPTSKPWPV